MANEEMRKTRVRLFYFYYLVFLSLFENADLKGSTDSFNLVQ